MTQQVINNLEPLLSVRTKINENFGELYGNAAVTTDVRYYGAVGDGVANDSAAIQAALNAIGALPNGGEVVASLGAFLTGTTALTVPQKVTFRLNGASIVSSAVNAIVVALGAGSTSGNVIGSGHNAIIEHTGTGYAIAMNGAAESSANPLLADFAVLGSGAGAAGVYATSFNGLTVRNVSVSGYTAGIGFYNHGNNAARYFGCVARGNLIGMQNTARPSYSANAIRVFGGEFITNTGWGLVENAEALADPNLANLYSGVVFENNGANASSTTGHIYISLANAVTIHGCYFEDYAGTVPVNAVVIGDPSNAPSKVVIQSNMFATSGTNVINNFSGTNTSIENNLGLGAVTNFVNQGSAARGAVILSNRAAAATNYFAGSDGGVDTIVDSGAVLNGRATSVTGSSFNSISGLSNDLAIRTRSGGANAAVFQAIDGTPVGSVSDAGAISGSEYRVSGTKVVGAQGAAVANATDAASVIARLNDLLARLRTHGLIAT